VSVFTAAVASMSGQWDIFDKVEALIESEIEAVKNASLSDFALNDPRREMLAALHRASKQNAEVCLTCQTVMARVPD
jgi:hypothetical protein